MDETKINCITCGSKEKLKRLNIDNLIRCQKCQLVFRDTRPSLKQIRHYYEEEYSSIFHEDKIGTHRTKIFERFLNRVSHKTIKGRLLDVGCSYGQFLKLAHNHGWDVYGIEPSKNASEYIKNNLGLKNIHRNNLKDINFSPDYFDVITLWNVLDHLPDPREQLNEMFRIIKPEGLLFLRIPNFTFQKTAFRTASFFDSLFSLQDRLSRKVSVFHLYCFSPASIKNLLHVAGFSVRSIRNSHMSEGDPYSSFTSWGERPINFIKKFSFLLFEAISYLSFKSLVWGPSMEIYSAKSQK